MIKMRWDLVPRSSVGPITFGRNLPDYLAEVAATKRGLVDLWYDDEYETHTREEYNYFPREAAAYVQFFRAKRPGYILGVAEDSFELSQVTLFANDSSFLELMYEGHDLLTVPQGDILKLLRSHTSALPHEFPCDFPALGIRLLYDLSFPAVYQSESYPGIQYLVDKEESDPRFSEPRALVLEKLLHSPLELAEVYDRPIQRIICYR